jgi:hypothetical protein
MALCVQSAPWIAEAMLITGAAWTKDISDILPYSKTEKVSELLENNRFLNTATKYLATLSRAFSDESVKYLHKEAYSSAIDDIADLYTATVAHSISPCILDVVALQCRVISMPVRLPAILTLLESHDIPALALLAHSLVLLKVIGHDNSWWLNGAQGCHVADQAVQGIYKLMPEEWRWTMEWPLKVLSEALIP